MLFKEGARVYLSCVSVSEAEMRITPKGKNVTSLRVRATGKWGVLFYELVAWDEFAVAMNKGVTEGGLRVIAIGTPRDEVYQDRVQHKLNVEELWVENMKENKFEEVISKNGVPDQADRVYEPIEVPESIPG